MNAIVQSVWQDFKRFGTWRWYLVVGVILLCGFIGINQIHVLMLNHPSVRANWFDFYFIVSNNVFYVLVAFVMVFAYLVSHLTKIIPFDHAVILQMGSRRNWWLSKCITTAILAFIYTLLHLGSFFVMSSTAFGISLGWSSVAMQMPEMVLIRSEMLNAPPLTFALLNFLLLFLGAFGIGLLVQMLTVWTGQSYMGFVGIFVLVACSIGINNFGLSDQLARIFIHQHMVGGQIYGTTAVVLSIGYWVSIIIICLTAGWIIFQRLDLLQ